MHTLVMSINQIVLAIPTSDPNPPKAASNWTLSPLEVAIIYTITVAKSFFEKNFGGMSKVNRQPRNLNGTPYLRTR